jgi:tetratricopeptide (TPR) repeat protein
MPGSRYLESKLARVCAIVAAMFCSDTLSLNAQIVTKNDLQKEIATYEAAARQTQTSNTAALQSGRIWSHLGTLYQDAGRYGQSEMAFERAMRLLSIAPVSNPDLATTIDDLGTLYLEMGNVKEAERAEAKALKMREQANLTSDLAQSWYHLATLYLREHQSRKAKEFAQRAAEAFFADPNAAPEDKIGSSLVLASALCQSHAYPDAIVKLKSALQISNETFGPENLSTGLSSFLLGYANWKNGDLASASPLMQRGAEILDKEMGWDHPAYLCVMTQYARFLRAEHRENLARSVEQEVKSRRAQQSSNPAYDRGLQTTDVLALF